MRLPRFTGPSALLRTAFLAAALFSGHSAQAGTPTAIIDPAAIEIEHRLSTGGEIKIGAQSVDGDALQNFYQSRQWRPAWTPDLADQVTAILNTAPLDGIPASPLHLAALAALRKATNSPANTADAELLLSDAVMRYAAAMRGRRVDPGEIEDDWLLTTPEFDPVAFLQSHSRDIVPALQGLQVPYAGYQALRSKMAELTAIAAAGDWPKVPSTGPTIKPGMTDDRLLAVRKRLEATGELPVGSIGGANFDEPLQEAVKLFQRRNGLVDDAQLGRQTIATLNLSAAERARQIAVNMERWRWLPPKLEDNHIIVNVPGAWLEVVENGRAVLTMRTIVGDVDHPTPALRARLNAIILNPTWSVPTSIATQEILPKLKKDPGYLVANDLIIVSDAFPPGSPESEGIGIDWHSYSTFPGHLRQLPGSDNALGRIKFAIPNSEDIYLHDTPNHKLFDRSNRALSHGCVRLDLPDELALYLLRDKGWDQTRLTQEIDTGDTRTIPIAKTLPVWLLYWTIWVDADGVMQVRDDLYGRDQRLAAALAKSGRGPINPPKNVISTPKNVCEGCRVP